MKASIAKKHDKFPSRFDDKLFSGRVSGPLSCSFKAPNAVSKGVLGAPVGRWVALGGPGAPGGGSGGSGRPLGGLGARQLPGQPSPTTVAANYIVGLATFP